MDFVSPVAEIIHLLWDPVSRRVGYLKNLSHNIRTLEKETKQVKDMHVEVHASVLDAVSVGKLRVTRVDDWLNDAGDFITQVELIRLEFDQRQTCLMGLCIDCVSRYRLGKEVVEKIECAKDLKNRGVFDKAKVAISPPRQRVQMRQISLPTETQNTFEKTLDKIWQSLHDEQNAIICVFGIGGIGKTTLMAATEKRLSETKEFNVVIWVTVSKDFRLELIQESIGRQLDLKFEPNENKRSKIFLRLKNIKYMLFLDDLWEAFHLDDVGIPKPNKENGCKIAITTRSIEVCNNMQTNKKIQAGLLTNEEAWNLFREKAGDVVLLSEIQLLAEKVVKECAGLPLAIKVVGGAMKEKNKKELWKNTLSALKSSAISKIRGMESKVFIPLKYSYDSLQDTKLQTCFLYCSLFPEDQEIPIEELVRYWAFEEELVDNTIALQEALDKGYSIIERLKDSCLLDEGKEGGRFLRMHDLIRDLAIWITCPTSSSSSQAAKFLIKAGEGLQLPPKEKMWEAATRISLMGNELVQLPLKPCCPNLVTLLLCNNRRLVFIYDHFFENIPQLQILDLSFTSIKSLPASLSELKNLRALICKNCSQLKEIPTLKQLEKLQLLDLFACHLKNVPEGMADLKELRQLYVSRFNRPTFPSNLISGLKSLEDLKLFGEWSEAAYREAATLPRLTSFGITLSGFNGMTADDLQQKFNWKDMTRFEIRVAEYDVKIGFVLSNVEYMKVSVYDKIVWIRDQERLPLWIEGLTRHAEVIGVVDCEGLTHLTQLIGQSRSIRFIVVARCEGVKCIIDGREVGVVGALECWEELHLYFLDDLKKVFCYVDEEEEEEGPPPLPRPTPRFHRLRRIVIGECHKLKHVFSSGMVEHLQQLQELKINRCYAMVEIIGGERGLENSFPRLINIVLMNLPKLRRICSSRQRMGFTSIEYIKVCDCLVLEKLPILCSAKIQSIQGEILGSREWWEGILEWELDDEDEAHSKSIYSDIYFEN